MNRQKKQIQKTPAELLAENEYLKRARVAEGIVSVFNNLIKYSFLAFAFYCTYLMVDALAGKETIGNLVFNMVTDMKANQWLAYLVGGCGAGYGIAQRTNRKNTVSRLHKRTKDLELLVDPNRSSSLLTSSGDTRPEDK